MLMPAFRVVVPWLYILRCLESMGKTPLVNSPFFLDYIKQKSMAETGTWIAWIGTAARILSLSGAMVVSTTVNVSYIFETFGALLVVASIIMVFGIKEVSADTLEKGDAKLSKLAKLKLSLKEWATQVRIEKSIGVAMAANFVNEIQHIAVYQFGFLIYWTQYAPDQKSQNYVSDKLSIINFTA